MPLVYLGLGSNIGDKEDYINKALSLLSEFTTVKRVSHLYLTEPVGNAKQDWFLNCAIEIETEAEPKKLLSCIKTVEHTLGRTKTLRNGPRCIDIDILFYEDCIIKTKTLVIPHPSMQERLFVLRPLMDLNPSFIHPVLKKSIRELYKSQSWTHKVKRYK
jgi:2-amino-4-hydroxy-6-hydroxymethyldihydropteridine diphosphokinase